MMRNVTVESLSEHCMETAVIAHVLAVIGNTYFGKSYNADRVCTLALYHDAPEVYTSDLPTPIKYFNEDMRQNYSQIEAHAVSTLLDKLPKQLQQEYASILRQEDKQLEPLIKMADKLCAYIKCLEEQKSGNSEFVAAGESILAKLNSFECPELTFFMEQMLPSFSHSVDLL